RRRPPRSPRPLGGPCCAASHRPGYRFEENGVESGFVPTYSYACSECGHAFDLYQSFSDDALTVCPECGGVLRKKFSSVGVVFKGSGFYRTDSRTDGRGSTGSTSSAPSKASGSAGGSGSPEKKPDAPAKPAASASSGASA